MSMSLSRQTNVLRKKENRISALHSNGVLHKNAQAASQVTMNIMAGFTLSSLVPVLQATLDQMHDGQCKRKHANDTEYR